MIFHSSSVFNSRDPDLVPPPTATSSVFSLPNCAVATSKIICSILLVVICLLIRALFDPNLVQSPVKWIWQLKILFLRLLSLDLLLSHQKNWLVVRIISLGQLLWNSGSWDRVMRIILLHRRMIYLVLTRCTGRKSMHNYVAYYGSRLIQKFCVILRAYKTCSKFWNQAKALYTNDIQRLYKVASAIVNIRQQDMDLSNYIGQIASLKEEFLTLMPLTSDVGAQQTQVDKFFMVLTLIGLRPDLETLRDQILGSPSVPSLDDVFARLLRISSTQTLPSDSPLDSSVLVSHTNLRGGRSGTRGRGQRPHCSYCNKFGHTRDRCYQLHGRPPRTAHVAQSSDSHSQSPQTLSSCTSQGVPPTDSEYDAYLRYQAAKSDSVASVAQTGNASACLTHTSSLGPWILDSGASDHISGNKDLFSSLTTTPTLPTVTLANGSQTMAKGIGLAHPLPSLPLTSVLYTPECPFNLISISKITRTLNCSIIFSDKFVTLQDRSTGKTIGIRRESQGLYHLTSQSSPAVCVSTDAPLLIHSRLGHPSLSKFQKMVPRFSTLSSLACESCQLGKHTRVSFPQRLNNRATSPFDLVHTDVWGPCRTASTLGFQYFVTFIDDYSRCTWLFLMKTRAELFSIF